MDLGVWLRVTHDWQVRWVLQPEGAVIQINQIDLEFLVPTGANRLSVQKL